MELLASDREHSIQLAVPFDVPPLSGLKRGYEEVPEEILEPHIKARWGRARENVF
jgi:hypothetical protein